MTETQQTDSARAGRTAADLDANQAPGAETSQDDSDVEAVTEAMKDVVDLGLVYGIRVEEDNVAVIDMTLTSAACPLTDVIEAQAQSAVVGPGVSDDLRINWVWMPPWGPDKITEDGREQLRALGFTV
jgi:metal-sulfur cluster biosynthetic enzyme